MRYLCGLYGAAENDLDKRNALESIFMDIIIRFHYMNIGDIIRYSYMTNANKLR